MNVEKPLHILQNLTKKACPDGTPLILKELLKGLVFLEKLLGREEVL